MITGWLMHADFVRKNKQPSTVQLAPLHIVKLARIALQNTCIVLDVHLAGSQRKGCSGRAFGCQPGGSIPS